MADDFLGFLKQQKPKETNLLDFLKSVPPMTLTAEEEAERLSRAQQLVPEVGAWDSDPKKWTSEFWYALGETWKETPAAKFVTKDYWSKAGKNLLTQAADMMATETITPIGKQRRLVEYGLKAIKGLKGEEVDVAPLEEAKGYARSGADFLLFIPKTIINMMKDPVKTIQEDPLDVMMLVGATAGIKAARKIKAKRAKVGWATTGDFLNPLKAAEKLSPTVRRILDKVPADIEIELPPKEPFEIIKYKKNGIQPFFKHWWDGIKADIIKAGDLPDRPLKFHKYIGLRVPIRVFEMFPWMKRLFYDEARLGQYNKLMELKGIKKTLKNYQRKVGTKGQERVGVYADYMQEGGAEIMKHMKKPKPKLTPAEMEYYIWGQQLWQDLLPRMNRARALAGEKPIGEVPNYSTWIRNLSELPELGIDITKAPPEVIEVHLSSIPLSMAKHRKPGIIKAGVELNYGRLLENYTQQALEHIHMTPTIAKARALLEPFKITSKTKIPADIINPEVAMLDKRGKIWRGRVSDHHAEIHEKMYNAEATNIRPGKPAFDITGWALKDKVSGKDIFVSIREVDAMQGDVAGAWLKKAKRVEPKETIRTKTTKWDIFKESPRLANWFQEWTDTIAGQKRMRPAGKAGAFVKMANTLNKNIAMAILSYNVRSALIQPTALKLSYVYLGEKYLLSGLLNNMKPSMRKFAMTNSQHLATRVFDIHAGEILGAQAGKKFGGLRRKVAQTGMKPLQYLDFETARATWLGAYELGTKKYGYTRKMATTFADDVVVKTQASAQLFDIAPIQRTPWGKLMTLFQTFVINEYDFLTHDVFGYKNRYANMKTRSMNIGRFVLASAVVNALYEGIVKLRSPYPAPEWALIRGIQGEESAVKIAGSMVRETMEQLPIIGGTIRWSTPYRFAFPAFMQTGIIDPMLMFNRMLDKPSLSQEQLEWMGKMLGIPGTSQVAKYVRRRRKGMSHIEAIVGIRAEEKK